MITVSKNKFPKKSEVREQISRLISNKGVIYCLYFPRSEKMYIGQTNDFWHRMSCYRTNFINGRMKKEQTKLFNALTCYDFKFTLSVLNYDIPVEELDEQEILYIEMFDTFKNGYNMTGGGKVLRGEMNPMYGKKHSEETKTLMSEKRMGDPRPKSEEWRLIQSEFMKNNNPNSDGLSEEHKQRVSATKIEKNIQKYAENDIDISYENICNVLKKNHNNIRKTSADIGCGFGVIQRFCRRHNVNVSKNMTGDNNPKRLQSIEYHKQRGIDISSENILKVLDEHEGNIAKTAKYIGCRWSVIKSFCNKNNI